MGGKKGERLSLTVGPQGRSDGLDQVARLGACGAGGHRLRGGRRTRAVRVQMKVIASRALDTRAPLIGEGLRTAVRRGKFLFQAPQHQGRLGDWQLRHAAVADGSTHDLPFAEFTASEQSLKTACAGAVRPDRVDSTHSGPSASATAVSRG